MNEISCPRLYVSKKEASEIFSGSCVSILMAGEVGQVLSSDNDNEPIWKDVEPKKETE